HYYTHHPYGVFLTSALSYLFLGHSWAAVRFPAAAMSALTAPLLYLLGRALWGEIAGAACVLVFASLPVDLAYASYQNLEVVTIFFGALFSLGAVRTFQTWRPRWIAISTVGALGTCHGDWIGMVLVGAIGIAAFVRAYAVPSGWVGRIDA